MTDDIEDKNASYSEYSVSKASTSSRSTPDNNQQRKKKKTLFRSLYTRFSKMIGNRQSKQGEEKKEVVDFGEQMK